MAEKLNLSLPLRFPNPHPSKPLFQDPPHHLPQHHPSFAPPLITSPPPSLRRSSRKPRLGKAHDPNRGKPWSIPPRVSISAHRALHSPSPDLPSSLSSPPLRSLIDDLIAIIEALEFHKKPDLALAVFSWCCIRSAEIARKRV